MRAHCSSQAARALDRPELFQVHDAHQGDGCVAYVGISAYIHVYTHVDLFQVNDASQGDGFVAYVDISSCMYIHTCIYMWNCSNYMMPLKVLVVLRMVILVVARAYIHTCIYTRGIDPST
jgi:hypothetical protein